MRVLILSINYAPEPTGFAPHVARFAERLVESGDGVTVITGFPFAPRWRRYAEYDGQFTKREMINGVDVLRVTHSIPRRPGGSIPRLLMEATFCASSFVNLWRVRGRFDLVLYVGAQPAIAMLAAVIASLRRIPYALWINDLATEAARDVGIVRSPRFLRLLSAFEYRAYAGAAGAIVLCDAFRLALVAHGFANERVAIIRSPIDLVNIRPLETAGGFRRSNGIPENTFVVMFAGSMGLKQGMDNVVFAAKETSADPDVLWVLIGDGEARRDMERRVQDEHLSNVRMLPLQPEDEMAEMFASADLLLLNQMSSVKDSVIPSKLLTYMAAGKPVIAAVNGTSQAAEIVRDASGGVLVEPQNPTALANATLQMKQMGPQLLRSMGDCNRRYAEAFFDERKAFGAQRQFLLRVAQSRA